MKYFFSLILVAFVYLQTSAQSKFSIGYVNSLDFSSFNSYGVVKPELRLAYTIGGNVRYNFNEKLSITSGIQYSIKGFSLNVIYTSNNNVALGASKETWSFRFIEVPILLSYKSNGTSRFSLYTSAGLVPSYLMSLKIKSPMSQQISQQSGTYVTSTTFNRTELNPDFTKFILSGYIGIGGTIKLGEKFSLLLQPNFKYSLAHLNKHTYPNYKNSHPYSIGLLCGVFYNF